MSSTVQVIHPSGVLDAAHGGEIRQEISDVLTSEVVVLIDLENITFVDSSGLGALVMAFKAVREAGGRLCLCSVGEQPRMLFELTGMEQIFEVFPDRETFYQAINQSPVK